MTSSGGRMICSAEMKWLSKSTARDGTNALMWTSDRWTHQKIPLLYCSRPSRGGELRSPLLRLLELLGSDGEAAVRVAELQGERRRERRRESRMARKETRSARLRLRGSAVPASAGSPMLRADLSRREEVDARNPEHKQAIPLLLVIVGALQLGIKVKTPKQRLESWRRRFLFGSSRVGVQDVVEARVAVRTCGA